MKQNLNLTPLISFLLIVASCSSSSEKIDQEPKNSSSPITTELDTLYSGSYYPDSIKSFIDIDLINPPSDLQQNLDSSWCFTPEFEYTFKIKYTNFPKGVLFGNINVKGGKTTHIDSANFSANVIMPNKSGNVKLDFSVNYSHILVTREISESNSTGFTENIEKIDGIFNLMPISICEK